VHGLIDKPKTPALGTGKTAEDARKGYREAIFATSGASLRTPIYDGDALGAGAEIEGPAIIEEVTTTIVIEPGWVAKLHPSGSYVTARVTS
jgi:N-methylhydantoinase A